MPRTTASKPCNRRRGLSLLEVAVSATLLTTILMATLAVMHTGNSAVAQGEVKAAVQESGRLTLERALQPLAECRILALGLASDSVTYQVPVYTGQEGIDFDPDYDITWGSESEPDGGSVMVGFESLGTIDEAAEGVDYNRDGDLLDRFHQGHLARTDLVSGQVTPLGRSNLILCADDHAGDVNGDGTPDPLFHRVEGSLGGRSDVVITVWTVKTDRNRQPYLLRLKNKVTLRNPQE